MRDKRDPKKPITKQWQSKYNQEIPYKPDKTLIAQDNILKAITKKRKEAKQKFKKILYQMT